MRLTQSINQRKSTLHLWFLNIIIRVQKQFYKSKLKQNEKNLIFAKFLMLIFSLQEIQLISEKSGHVFTNSNINNVFQFFEKYQFNFIMFDGNLPFLISIFLIQVSFITLGIFANYYQSNINLINTLLEYILIIHHMIMIQPIIYTTFHDISNTFQTILSLILLILTIFQELLFCLFYTQNSLIEIEGCYSKRVFCLFKLFCIMLISYLSSYKMNLIIGQSLFLIFQCLQFLRCLHNYHSGNNFYSKLNIIIISCNIALLANEDWIVTVLIYILFFHLRTQIRLRKLQTEIIDNRDEKNLFKCSLLESNEFMNGFKEINYLFSKTYLEKIKLSQLQIIEHGKASDKLFMIMQVYKQKQILLYINLITIPKHTLTFLQKINLEANLLNIIQGCSKEISTHLNISLYIKSLQEEELNFQILMELIDQKTSFYKHLLKEAPIQSYLSNFSKELDRIVISLQNVKKTFEKQYDLTGARLRDFNKSDQVSINIVKSFYQIFFNNYIKFKVFEKKQNELLVYDRIMNTKIMKSNNIIQLDEALLISVSYIKDRFQILNNESKRLLSLFQDEYELQKFPELLPQFQKNIYFDFINQFINSGLDIGQPLKLYLEINQYLVEYELYISATISSNDIILHHFVVQKSQPNNFILFGYEGRILGISQQIYSYITSKSKTQFSKTLSVRDFISFGMIQYYITDIDNHISDYCKLASSGNTQTILFFQSTWKFPENHKECLEQTQALMLIKDDKTTLSEINSQLSPKRVTKKKQSSNNYTGVQTLRNINIKMIQKTLISQISSLVLPASGEKSLDLQGTLEFFVYNSLEKQFHYFVLSVKEIEEFHEQLDSQHENDQNVLQFVQNEAYYFGLGQDYEFIEDIINSDQQYSLLIYDILLIAGMIFVSITALILSYNDNYQVTIHYQEKVNFLNTPQAMTFCFTEPFLLNWNQMCADDNLYEVSPEIVDQRINMMAYVDSFCNSVRQENIMQLSERSGNFGVEQVDFISYLTDNTKQITAMDIFELYTITYESIIRQYRNSMQLENKLIDHSIFRPKGIMRQNILTILRYHDLVLDMTIAETSGSISNITTNNFAILIYSNFAIIFLLLVFTIVNYRLLNRQEKMAKLIRFLNQHIISDHIEQLEYQKEILARLMLRNRQEVKIIPSLKVIDNSNTTEGKLKSNTLTKIELFHVKYYLILIITFIIGVQLLLFIFGSLLVAMLYNQQYQNSLILTMQYLKLKNRLDSAVLIGELIKTEQYVVSNDLGYINQSETIEYFLNNIDVVMNLSSQINVNLAQSQSYNSTFKQRLIDIFNNNLCQNYASLLTFCNIDQIKLEYFEADNYADLIENGIYGIVQVLSKLRIQEYNFEETNMSYEYDLNHAHNFLRSQIHQNLFIQYFMDIQKCIYYCFVDIFAETQRLSDILLNRISIYLVTASVMYTFINVRFVIFTSSVAGIWVMIQTKKLNQMKLIATLFPASLLQQKGFKTLLYSQLLRIK